MKVTDREMALAYLAWLNPKNADGNPILMLDMENELAIRFAKARQEGRDEATKELANNINNFVSKQESIPAHFAKVLNDNFWDLVGDGKSTTPTKGHEERAKKIRKKYVKEFPLVEWKGLEIDIAQALASLEAEVIERNLRMAEMFLKEHKMECDGYLNAIRQQKGM